MNRLNGRHSLFPCIKHLVSAHQTQDKGAQYPAYASLYIKRVKGQTGFFNAKNVSFLPTNAQHRRITYTKTCLKFLSKSFQTLSPTLQNFHANDSPYTGVGTGKLYAKHNAPTKITTPTSFFPNTFHGTHLTNVASIVAHRHIPI